MTKSEIVEALRCAADLCGSVEFANQSVVTAALSLGLSTCAMDVAIRSALGHQDWAFRQSAEHKRHDLLEAAQRIEEGE